MVKKIHWLCSIADYEEETNCENALLLLFLYRELFKREAGDRVCFR